MQDSKANIWISFSPDIEVLGRTQGSSVCSKGGWWDANEIGISPQPIHTSDGWLIMYHGVHQTTSKASYRLGLALLILKIPGKFFTDLKDGYSGLVKCMNVVETLMMLFSLAGGF